MSRDVEGHDSVKKIGIVGAGKRYVDYYKDVIESFDLEISGFVTQSGKLSDEVGDYEVFATVSELVNHDEPDFLLAVVPYYATPQIVLEATKVECDILVETPFPPPQHWDVIRATVEESGIVVGVVEQWPFLPLECFKKKVIEAGLLGDIHLVENDYRTYNYHGMAQLRNYVGKDVGIKNVIASTHKNYPLNDNDDYWNITLAEFENGATLLFKHSDLAKREIAKNMRGTPSIRIHGSKGTFVSGCLLKDESTPWFSAIAEDGDTYNRGVGVHFDDGVLVKLTSILPNGSEISWENNYFEHGFDESQIAIAQHIESMMNGDMLWTMEDGLIDLSLGDSSWI